MNERMQATGKFLKFLQFPPIRIFLGFLVLSVITFVAQIGTDALFGHEAVWANLLSVFIAVFAVSFAYYGFVRLIERRSVTELSLTSSVKELAGGVVVGMALFSAAIGILWALGYYRVSGINGWATIVPWFVLAIISGVVEEILFRGVLFRILEESLGTWPALATSALIFGLLHLANPNATLWGGIAIAIEAGIMLAAAYMYTRRLWLPIGIHFAWNFTQGAIFGVAVSGNEAKGLLQSNLSGPVLLSGGDFGAEASIFAVVICLAAGIYFLQKSSQQGEFIKPFWKR
ncbi:MAG: CPBP family intramembrane metalloprotease [Chloroflexi bacterium]|nr:CPBP family intramembrane metalloprotease [Chloroflexota bacterium]